MGKGIKFGETSAKRIARVVRAVEGQAVNIARAQRRAPGGFSKYGWLFETTAIDAVLGTCTVQRRNSKTAADLTAPTLADVFYDTSIGLAVGDIGYVSRLGDGTMFFFNIQRQRILAVRPTTAKTLTITGDPNPAYAMYWRRLGNVTTDQSMLIYAFATAHAIDGSCAIWIPHGFEREMVFSANGIIGWMGIYQVRIEVRIQLITEAFDILSLTYAGYDTLSKVEPFPLWSAGIQAVSGQINSNIQLSTPQLFTHRGFGTSDSSIAPGLIYGLALKWTNFLQSYYDGSWGWHSVNQGEIGFSTIAQIGAEGDGTYWPRLYLGAVQAG